MDRDFDTHPYSPDEQRVADYIVQISNGLVGGGDDPIGFLISSHQYNTILLKKAANALEEKTQAKAVAGR